MPTDRDKTASPSPKIGWDSKSAPPPEPVARVPGWRRLSQHVSTKLIALLVVAMVIIFALLGYANIRLHRQNLEAATLLSAERVSDVIKRSTSQHMMRNDREALYQVITTIGRCAQAGLLRMWLTSFSPSISGMFTSVRTMS